MSKFDPTVAVVGRIGTDPEIKEGARGPYVTFRLAREFLDSTQTLEHTIWYTVYLDGGTIPANVTKGKSVEVRGTQSIRPGTDKDGNTVDYYSIRAEAVDEPKVTRAGRPRESFTISGRVGRDPETKVSQAGNTYYKFSLAHNYSMRDEAGEWIDYPVWYDVVTFDAELPDFIAKGALVEVRGVDSVRPYFSEKFQEQREARSVRAFELTVPDSSPAAVRPLSMDDAPF